MRLQLLAPRKQMAEAPPLSLETLCCLPNGPRPSAALPEAPRSLLPLALAPASCLSALRLRWRPAQTGPLNPDPSSSSRASLLSFLR